MVSALKIPPARVFHEDSAEDYFFALTRGQCYSPWSIRERQIIERVSRFRSLELSYSRAMILDSVRYVTNPSTHQW